MELFGRDFVVRGWLEEIAAEIIAKRKGEENQQPDDSSSSRQMQKTTASLDVHEEERHEQGF